VCCLGGAACKLFSSCCGAFQNLLSRNTTVSVNINVRGNGQDIASGNTATTADHTDFGGVDILNTASVVRTFTIQNTFVGGDSMTLSSTVVAGTGFTLSTAPAGPVAASSETECEVTFDPPNNSAVNPTGTLTISSNDPDTGTFTINLKGTALCQYETCFRCLGGYLQTVVE
jgi:hypothetical protein